MGKKMNAKQQRVAMLMGQYRAEEFSKLTNNLVPCVYSAIAISLYEKGWRHQRINDLFIRSQEIWEEYCNDDGTMMDTCERLTGIAVRDIAEKGL